MNILVIDITDEFFESFNYDNNIKYDGINIRITTETNKEIQCKIAEKIKNMQLITNTKILRISGKLIDSSMIKYTSNSIEIGYHPNYTLLTDDLLRSIFNKSSSILEEIYIENVKLNIRFLSDLLFINHKKKNYYCLNRYKILTKMKCVIPNIKIFDIRCSDLNTIYTPDIHFLSIIHRFMVYSDIDIIRFIFIHNFINYFDSIIDNELY